MSRLGLRRSHALAIPLAATLALATWSCRHEPPVTVRSGSPIAVAEMVSRASCVFVGVVKWTEQSGPEIRTNDANRYRVRQERIGVRIEHIIKGSPASGDVIVHRYAWAAGRPLLGAAGLVEAGGRYVFFADQEKDGLRALVDIFPFFVEVTSGRPVRAPEEASVGEQVASVLLQPGSEMDAARMSRGLASAVSVAVDLAGWTKALNLTKELLLAPQGEIKRAACFALAHEFYGQGGCLFSKGSMVPPDPEVQAEQMDYRRKDADLKRALQRDAMAEVRRISGHDDHARILETLKMLAQHQDAEVRRRACQLAKDSFTEGRLEGCQ